MLLLLALLQELDGIWRGTLEAGVPLRLNVRISGGSGTMDSVDQGDLGRKIDAVSFKDKAVRLELKSIGGVYEGAMSDDGAEIAGRWTQGGASLPLTLRRAEEPFVLKRPQEPKRPFPYEEEDVEFRNGAHTLAGTLTRPKGPGPFPAAVLISGSGPQDRDESLMGHKPFLVLSDFLTRRGIAVLRYDDRGVGKSTGDFAAATTADFAEDARAGVDFLKERKDVGKIGLIGHSEGGVIAPLVASTFKEVAFIVLLAGTGVPGDELLLLQTDALNRAAGLNDAQRGMARQMNQAIYKLVKTEDDPKELERKLRSFPLAPAQRKGVLSPWFRHFVRHDPRPALRKVECPVLALIGEKDLQVPARENLAAIREALKENKDADGVELPGLNHLFQACATGAVAEYGRIEETFNPAALKLVGDWIEKRAR